jgi:hypothetical protein
MFNSTIRLSTNRTNPTGSALTTDNGHHYLVMRGKSGLLPEKLDQTLKERDVSTNNLQFGYVPPTWGNTFF